MFLGYFCSCHFIYSLKNETADILFLLSASFGDVFWSLISRDAKNDKWTLFLLWILVPFILLSDSSWWGPCHSFILLLYHSACVSACAWGGQGEVCSCADVKQVYYCTLYMYGFHIDSCKPTYVYKLYPWYTLWWTQGQVIFSELCTYCN